METLRQLRGYLLEWRQDEAAILKKAEQSTISAAIEHLRCGPGLRERFSQAQDELYLTTAALSGRAISPTPVVMPWW